MKNYVKKETDKDGTTWYFDENGIIHRTDGPAIEFSNEAKQWRVHGKLHRIDGPARIWYDGEEEWYVNNFWIVGSQINKLQKLRRIINDNDLLNKLLFSGQLVI